MKAERSETQLRQIKIKLITWNHKILYFNPTRMVIFGTLVERIPGPDGELHPIHTGNDYDQVGHNFQI